MGFTNFTNNTNVPPNTPTNVPPNIPMNIQIMQNSSQPQFDIDDICINYNTKYAMHDNTLFRNKAIELTLSVLLSTHKSNPLLIGPAGVGKTKIVESIAYRLANTSNPNIILPDELHGYTLYELPLARLMANTAHRGDLEAKMFSLLNYCQDPNNKIILFIDEIHLLMDTAYTTVAQILKPALARNNIKVIGATTTQENKQLSTDPAFNRRFSQIIVDELSPTQTVTILENVTPTIVNYHNNNSYTNNIIVDPTLYATCVTIADNYKTAGSHRPDNAITLMDKTIANAIMRKTKAISAVNNDPQLRSSLIATPITISEALLRTVAKQLLTGVQDETNVDKTTLTNALSVIKGQDAICSDLVNKLYKRQLNIVPSKKPLTLLFTGSSGVGKTQIAKILSETITHTEPIILNMPEYHSSASINRIIGTPAGYVGYDENSELPFDILKSNPYQIIVLDEFEKCHQSIQRLFMSVLDEGYLTTNRNEKINFSKAIIIATSNATEIKKNQIGFTNTATASTKQQLIEALKTHFDTALLNRFTEIYEFNTLSKDIYAEILKATYSKMVQELKASNMRCNILLDDIPDDVLTELVDTTYVPEFGARPINNVITEYIESQI